MVVVVLAAVASAAAAGTVDGIGSDGLARHQSNLHLAAAERVGGTAVAASSVSAASTAAAVGTAPSKLLDRVDVECSGVRPAAVAQIVIEVSGVRPGIVARPAAAVLVTAVAALLLLVLPLPLRWLVAAAARLVPSPHLRWLALSVGLPPQLVVMSFLQLALLLIVLQPS